MASPKADFKPDAKARPGDGLEDRSAEEGPPSKKTKKY
jgi:hypothetical protein